MAVFLVDRRGLMAAVPLAEGKAVEPDRLDMQVLPALATAGDLLTHAAVSFGARLAPLHEVAHAHSLGKEEREDQEQ